MAGIKEIAVRVGADIEPLKKGFKTASQITKDFGKDVKKNAKDLLVLSAAVTATAGALVAMASASADNAKEIKNLSGVAGTGVKEFQRLAFAAKSVGIEQDKLADIYKDSLDKVGDFLQTGGGPLVDFFENIAPKIGVTAEEFRHLSGPQVLQKYTDGLEQANLSQSEMTFFLEAIASDAALLQPLLINNGEGFAKLAEQSDKLGASLSAIEIDNLVAMKGSLVSIQSVASTAIDKFSAGLAPAIKLVADEFLGLSDSAISGESSVNSLVNSALDGFADLLEGAAGVIEFVENNEDIAGMGVLGFIVFGKKGLLIGAAVGAVFGELKRAAMQASGTFDPIVKEISELERSLAQSQGQYDIAEALGNTDQMEKIAFWTSVQSMRVRALKEEIADNNPLQAQLNELMGEGEEGGNRLSAAMNAAADAIRNRNTATEEANEIPASSGIDPRLERTKDIDFGSPMDDPEVKHSLLINDQLLANYQDFAKKRIEGEKVTQKAIIDVQKFSFNDGLNAASTALGNLSSLMSSENKKQFEIGKAAAKGQAVIDTIASAQAAYKSLAGIPIVGPGLGVAAAAAATVAGLARISAINSTSFGGGGGGSAVTAGASTGGASHAGGASQGGGPSSTLFLDNVSPDSFFSGATMLKLIERMKEFEADGGGSVVVL